MSTTNSDNRIGETSFATPTDRELVIARTFDSPRQVLFDTWTKPQHLPHWMLGPPTWTMTVCEIDLRPGGAWHFAWRKDDGAEMGMRGVYKEISPPERLVNTESWGAPWPDTLNTLALTEENGRTNMTVTVLYPTREARDAALNTGMQKGIAASFDRLAEYLRTLTKPSPETKMATKIFVNLPVKDLKRSMSFYAALGHKNNPQFTDETAACMVVSEDIFVMLLTHAKFKEFTPKQICDATRSSEVLNCLSCDSRQAVEDLVKKATAAGGTVYAEPKDHGFMYQHGFQDPDGHIWELIYMQPGVVKE